MRLLRRMAVAWSLVILAICPCASADRVLCLASASGASGAVVSLPMGVDDGNGVAGFQADVHFDAQLLTPINARLGRDTAAAGSWSVDRQTLAAGVLRVLGFRNPPAGLAAGFRELAIVDFQVAAGRLAQNEPMPLDGCVLGDFLGVGLPCTVCTPPGLDTAIPRFATVLVDDTLGFRPARTRIEPGDLVTWSHVGVFERHTTTSGAPCVASGVWRSELAPGSRFTRRFLEPPGPIPYHCEPHCPLGMVGEVLIVPPIALSVDHVQGMTLLSWTGGLVPYVVHRAGNPAFTGPGHVIFTPGAGGQATSFVDPDPGLPPAGQALFYLVTAGG